MNKLNLDKFIRNTRIVLSKKSPDILTGIGISGMITTTILAVEATPKVVKLLENETKNRIKTGNRDDNDNIEGLIKVPEDKNGNYGHYRLPAKDILKIAWKYYIPATVTGAASVMCLIGARSVSARRNAALTAAYKLSETALSEYKEKVIETVGEKKEKLIKEKVYKDHLDKKPVNKSEVIVTEKGNTLCYDHLSGRYFKSDIEQIKKAINIINKRMINNDYVSLNEFYDEIGLAHTLLGEQLGWKLDNGLIEEDFGTQMAADGTPCIVVDFNMVPSYEYDRYI